MTNREQLLLDAFDFLDGLCSGHSVAGVQSAELAQRLWDELPAKERHRRDPAFLRSDE